mmetsp:Transcript_32588/g.96791  ORF Transcript_32588/g.96791 Transcript_32588/m.96791 type:complete len:396 (+) Transcript_32588:842-2029(+)
MLDGDAQLCRHALDLLPIGHVLVTDLHRPGEELDGELLAALLFGLPQEPPTHHEPQGAVATCDGDDSGLRELHHRAELVLLAMHLPLHIPAPVQDARVVVTEGLDAEHLGNEILGVLAPEGPLRVDVLDRNGRQLRAGSVAHAKDRGICDEADALLLVNLPLLRHGVAGQDAQATAASRVVPETLQDPQEHLGHGVLLLVHVGDRVARRRVDANGEDDHGPRVHVDELLDGLLVVGGRGLGLHVLDADAAGRRLLQDLLGEAVAVAEHEEVLLGHLGPVRRRPLPAVEAQRVGEVLQVEVDRVPRRALRGQVLREPLHGPARLGLRQSAELRDDPLVGLPHLGVVAPHHLEDGIVAKDLFHGRNRGHGCKGSRGRSQQAATTPFGRSGATLDGTT